MLKPIMVLIDVLLIGVEAQNVYVVLPESYFKGFFISQNEFFKKELSEQIVF